MGLAGHAGIIVHGPVDHDREDFWLDEDFGVPSRPELFVKPELFVITN
jgi:hypothetical protein